MRSWPVTGPDMLISLVMSPIINVPKMPYIGHC